MKTFTKVVGIISLLGLMIPQTVFGTVLFPVGGGTGTSTSPTYGQMLVGNAGGTYTLTATSSLGLPTNTTGLFVNNATNGTLTRSGTGPYTLGLNLSNSNTWLVPQTFADNVLMKTTSYPHGFFNLSDGILQLGDFFPSVNGTNIQINDTAGRIQYNASGDHVFSGIIDAQSGITNNAGNLNINGGTSGGEIHIDTTATNGQIHIDPGSGGLLLDSGSNGSSFFGNVFFLDGTVSAPSLSFITEGSTGIYKPATSQIGLSTNGTQLVLVDGTSPSVTTGYNQDAGLMVKTAYTSAGSNLKSVFKATNLGRNALSLLSRPDFNRDYLQLGNASNESYVIVESDTPGTNIPRIDFNYDTAYFGDPNNSPSNSQTNFRGIFNMVRQGVASSVSNQYSSGAIGFNPSAWSGSTDISTSIYNDVTPVNGVNEMLFWRVYTQPNIALYTGNHLSIQVNQPRTNPAYSGSIGINAPQTSTLQAHLDIFEDLASRTMFQLTGASSQSGAYVNIRDNSSNSIFKILSSGFIGIGTTTPYANLSIQSGISTGDAFAIATSSGATIAGFDNDGHRFTAGPAPAVSTCGTGTGTIVGDDQSGTVTTATAATACTVTFSKVYRNTPVCTVTDDSLIGFADVSSVSTSAVTFGISSALTGGHLYYSCSYHK